MKKMLLSLLLLPQILMSAESKSLMSESTKRVPLDVLKTMYEGKLLDRAIRDYFFLLKLGVEQDYAMRRQILSGAAQQLLALTISKEQYTIPISGVDLSDKTKVYQAQVIPTYQDNDLCMHKKYSLENVNGKDILCIVSASEIGEQLRVSFFDHKLSGKKSAKKTAQQIKE